MKIYHIYLVSFNFLNGTIIIIILNKWDPYLTLDHSAHCAGLSCALYFSLELILIFCQVFFF